MANRRGYHSHGSRGGKYARKSMLSIDFSNFYEYAEKLDNLGADLQEIFDRAMTEAGKEVQQDVEKAIISAKLPAHGKYSRGDTKSSVIKDLSVKWSGTIGEMGLGFDKTKPGAGGFLITGTPKMQPVRELADIFGSKKYERKIKKGIEKDLQKEIDRRMGNA